MFRALWAAVGPPVPSKGIRTVRCWPAVTHAGGGRNTQLLTFQLHLAKASALEKKDLQGLMLEPLPQGGPRLWASPGERGGGAVQRVFSWRASLSSLPRHPLEPLVSITGVGCCMAGCTHAAMSLAKTFLQIFFMGIEKK